MSMICFISIGELKGATRGVPRGALLLVLLDPLKSSPGNSTLDSHLLLAFFVLYYRNDIVNEEEYHYFFRK